MIDAVPFQMAHLALMDEVDGNDMSQARSKITQCASRSRIRTFKKNNEILAIMGITFFWDHVAEAWSVPSRKIERYGTEYIRATRRLIEDAEVQYQLHRLQATVRARYLKWAHVLGFRLEGTMRKFFPDGENCYLLARYPDGR